MDPSSIAAVSSAPTCSGVSVSRCSSADARRRHSLAGQRKPRRYQRSAIDGLQGRRCGDAPVTWPKGSRLPPSATSLAVRRSASPQKLAAVIGHCYPIWHRFPRWHWGSNGRWDDHVARTDRRACVPGGVVPDHGRCGSGRRSPRCWLPSLSCPPCSASGIGGWSLAWAGASALLVMVRHRGLLRRLLAGAKRGIEP